MTLYIMKLSRIVTGLNVQGVFPYGRHGVKCVGRALCIKYDIINYKNVLISLKNFTRLNTPSSFKETIFFAK